MFTFYLLERQNEGETAISSIHWLIPQIPSTGSGQRQEAGALYLDLTHGRVGTEVLEPSSAASQGMRSTTRF